MHAATLLLFTVLGANQPASSLRTIETPGFSVGLPHGDLDKKSELAASGTMTMTLRDDSSIAELVDDYDADQLFRRSDRILKLQWDAYSLVLAEDRRLIIDSIVRALPVKDARRIRTVKLDHARELHLVGNDDYPFGIAMIPCGPSLSVTIIMGFTRKLADLRAATRKIVDSVQCKPEAANIRPHEAAVRLPANFGRAKEPDAQMYMSTEGEVLVLAFITEDAQKSPAIFDTAMKAMLSTVLGLKDKTVTFSTQSEDPFPGRKARLVQVGNGGDLDGAFVATIYCPKLDITLLGMWYAVDGSREQALERLARVGCPGEPSEPVRAMADVFGEACKADNDIACAILEEMPQ